MKKRPPNLQRLGSSSPRFTASRRASPVCFTTTRAFDVLFPGVRASEAWGRQPVAVAGAEAWVMPSTSGRAAGYRAHVHRVLAELASALGRGS